MIVNGLKKLFIKQHILFVIILFVIIQICSTLYNGYEIDSRISDVEEEYNAYINKYHGKITKENVKEIEEEYTNSLDNSKIDKKKLFSFKVLYSKYSYSKEYGEGYIFDTRSWENVLTKSKTDFVLILFIIFICVMIYSEDFNFDMYSLLLTCKNGKTNINCMKLISGTLIASILTLITEIIKYVYLKSHLDFEFGNCKLKSLEFFENTHWNITLNQMYMYTIIIKVIGAVVLASLVSLIIVLIKSDILTIIICSVTSVIIEILFGNKNVILFSPTGLLKAPLFFFPTKKDYDYMGNEIIIFNELNKNEVITIISAFIFVTLILMLINIVISSKKYNKNIKITRKKLVMILVICVMGSCSGCGDFNNKDISKNVYAHSISSGNVDIGNGYNISINDKLNQLLLTSDKGEEMELILELEGREDIIKSLFLIDNYCYYITQNKSNTDGTFTVRYINIEDMTDNYLYTNENNSNEDFYGLKEELTEIEAYKISKSDVGHFMVIGDIIIVERSGFLEAININSNRKKVLADDAFVGTELEYKNGNVYYENYNEKKCKIELISE